jgi:hypothetical protein
LDDLRGWTPEIIQDLVGGLDRDWRRVFGRVGRATPSPYGSTDASKRYVKIPAIMEWASGNPADHDGNFMIDAILGVVGAGGVRGL